MSSLVRPRCWWWVRDRWVLAVAAGRRLCAAIARYPGTPAYEGESDYYSGSKPSRKRIGCAAGNRPYATSPSCVSSGELAL